MKTIPNPSNFIIIILFVGTTLFAQAPDKLWTRTYGAGVGNCVIETSDSGYVAVGSKEDSLGNIDLRLIKTNNLGDSLWSKTFGDLGSDIGNSVKQTSDSGFIILGSTSSYRSGEEDVWLIKTDANGDTMWTKTFGGNSSDVGNGIQITNDGGYVIVGTTVSYGAGGEDAWLIKTDSNGVIQWTKTFGDTADDQGKCLLQTSDTGYIIGGGSISFGGVWIIKTDANGDTSWTIAYKPGNWNREWLNSGIETNDGYVFAGGLVNGYIVKTDFLGDTLWTKLYKGRPTSSQVLNCVISTYSGLYLFLNSRADGIWWPNYNCDIFALDGNGNEIWYKTIGGTSLSSVIQATDSSYVVSGWADGDFFIAKLGYSLTGLKQSNENITNDFSLSQNYPNPFNPSTTIEFSLPKSEFTTLKVFNILGKEVLTLVSNKLHSGNHTYQFDGKNLASGIYYYQLTAGDYREVKKMILVR